MQRTYVASAPGETTDSPMIPQEHEWPRKLLYALVLAMLVIGLFLVGNPIQVSPAVVSVFPFLAAMLPIPLVLFFALWEKRNREGAFSMQAGFAFGEGMVRYAALIFGVFTLSYSVFVFEYISLQMVLVSGVGAMVGTWILGVVCAVVLALLFSRLSFQSESFPTSA